jgi:hypothetical protein
VSAYSNDHRVQRHPDGGFTVRMLGVDYRVQFDETFCRWVIMLHGEYLRRSDDSMYPGRLDLYPAADDAIRVLLDDDALGVLIGGSR